MSRLAGIVLTVVACFGFVSIATTIGSVDFSDPPIFLLLFLLLGTVWASIAIAFGTALIIFGGNTK